MTLQRMDNVGIVVDDLGRSVGCQVGSDLSSRGEGGNVRLKSDPTT
jgi:hypothetical protein